jgi:hypothetical protein
VLYRVFFLRVIDMELMSADADPVKLFGQFATIFASISFLFALPSLLILMGGGHMNPIDAWGLEHFFIETTITIAGLVAVLNWETAFPDKKDVLVLAPLPVRASTLFVAKVAALFAAPFLALILLNVFCGMTWPFVFGGASHGAVGLLRALPAYWLTIVLGGAFVVFALLALQGIVANLLPRQWFLRASAVIPAAVICLLVMVYFLEPSMRTPRAFAAAENQRVLQMLPSYWFFGLFHQLNGTMRPELEPLARRAWVGLGVSFVGAIVALLLSYLRMLPKTIEQPDVLPSRSGLGLSAGIAGGLRGAVTLFSVRTMMRSRHHRMILSFYLGLGLAMIATYLKTPLGERDGGASVGVPSLLASVLMVIFPVLAVRVVAAIPVSLGANWMVRLTQVRPAKAYLQAVRFSWIALAVAPVWLGIAAWLLAVSSWRPVVGHLALLLLLGMVLVELCLCGFYKVPFACSYLPGKGNIHFAFWASVLFFVRMLYEGAKYESRFLQSGAITALMLAGFAAVAVGLVWWNETSSRGAEMVFEEEYPAEVRGLDLRS